MSDETAGPAAEPHPDLAGLLSRKGQLESKLAKPAVLADPKVKARTVQYLAEVNAAIAEITPK